MGVTVRQKVKGGDWWVFVHHNSRRKSKAIGKDKGLAMQVAEKIKARLVLGDFRMDDPKVPNFKDYAERWLALPHDWKESTEHDLRNHVYSKFKNYRLDTIQRAELREFLDDLLIKGLAPSTVNRIKVTMGGVFNHAIDAEILQINPVDRLRVEGAGKRRNDIDPLTFEEADQLLKEFKTRDGGLYYPPLLCALRTGMRIGEIEAHKWGDIDFNGGFMWVRRSHRQGRITGTKNRLRRQVDMRPHLAATLKAWKLTQKKRSLAQGIPVPEWTFSESEGRKDDPPQHSQVAHGQIP